MFMGSKAAITNIPFIYHLISPAFVGSYLICSPLHTVSRKMSPEVFYRFLSSEY